MFNKLSFYFGMASPELFLKAFVKTFLKFCLTTPVLLVEWQYTHGLSLLLEEINLLIKF